ncbi:hypothetical protein B566_EDAN007110 [Ephemera danica]|nr:hypothetical protein B566_EDAN007110 [Ephemera danica]
MSQGCVAVMSVTWVTSVTLYAAMVLPRRYGGFHFNATGLHACEPWYPRASLRILASCLLYFPTTMVLMYCYGSAFHVNKLRLKHRAVVCSAAAAIKFYWLKRERAETAVKREKHCRSRNYRSSGGKSNASPNLLCRGGSGQNIESIPPPPGPGLPRGEHCCAVRGHTGHLPAPPEEAGEKHWGNIFFSIEIRFEGAWESVSSLPSYHDEAK